MSKLIPEISKEKVATMLEWLKPVCRKNGQLHHISIPDAFNTAFTWDPEYLREATDLVQVAEMRTYHTTGYILFFKPSIAEVYAQVDLNKLPTDVCAFETVATEPTVQMHTHDIADFYGHSTKTIFYAKRPAQS